MAKVYNILTILKDKLLSSSIIFDFLACMVLLFLYSFTFYKLLPDGVNQHFMTRLIILLPVPMALLFIFMLYLHRKSDYCQNRQYRNTTSRNFDIRDLLLLLLPLTPIARYIILNFEILNIIQSLIIFMIFFAIAFILTLIIPIILFPFGSPAFLKMTGLSFAFVIFNMAALSSDFNWHLQGSLEIQVLVLLIAFLIPLIIYTKDRKYLNLALIIFFLANIVTAINVSADSQPKQSTSDLYELTAGKEPLYKPDILLLTYEAYVENETMLQYGIDNSEQEKFLIEKGFYIYQGTWSIGACTISSMDRVLSLKNDILTREGISGNGAVQNILRTLGYETYGIFPSDYIFEGVGAFYDYNYPDYQFNKLFLLLSRQILEGEFRFDAIFENMDYPDYLNEKRKVLSENKSKPVFIYTHNWYPGHSQNSGQCRDDEIEIYEQNLIIANEEMRADVITAIDKNPDAIIVVSGDHGPYLTKNCFVTTNQYSKDEINRLDIQDRYGSFLAIRWPSGANINHADIMILQDIFPVIFAWIYNDPDLLHTRLERVTFGADFYTSGVNVENGIIKGGVDDGRPLFESMITN